MNAIPTVRPVDRLIGQYAESHRHPVNLVIHWICVPIIVWCVLAFAFAAHPYVAYAGAAVAHLSVSRYAERFRAATGMPVRNYLLWRRLLLAVEKLRGGASVTDAAHESGFSDAAHLSRSFRRILGATPSDLLL